MRPKRFGVKPLKTSPERFSRLTRIHPNVRKLAQTITEHGPKKIYKVADIVLEKIPTDWNLPIDKRRLFRRSAEESVSSRKKIGPLHCTEQCHLALGLLRASNVPAWLVREVDFNSQRKKWEGHSFVEAVINGQLYTLFFFTHIKGFDRPMDSYEVFEGPVEKNINHPQALYFRGADIKQIGGVGNYAEFNKFIERIKNNRGKEIEKNRRRVALMEKEGIIPEEVAWQLPI